MTLTKRSALTPPWLAVGPRPAAPAAAGPRPTGRPSPVRIVVPFVAGGTTDIARASWPRLAQVFSRAS